METPRLYLRPWHESDAASLYRWASDPQIGPAAGWAPHTSVENSREVIRTVLSEPNTFALILKDSDETGPVGSVGVFTTTAPGVADDPEIGYWIARPLWGRGLIPEVMEALLCWLFLDMAVQRVWCAHFPGNEKSRRVIEKCGFTYEGMLRDYFYIDEEYVGRLYFSMLRSEYEEEKN